jgi:hypothetical protein
MPDEFRPEASVDFEALAAFAAAEVAANGNGDGPHYTPPPEQAAPQAPPIRQAHADTNRPPQSGPSLGMDPFQALEKIVGDQGLMFRELGEINAKLGSIQLQTVVAFGAALLLAAMAWKLAKATG